MALALAACAGDAELDTLNNLAGPEAQEIDSFLDIILYIAYVVFALVLGVTIYSWAKFRIRTDDYEDDEFPEQIHGNDALEYAWTAAPALLMAGIAVFTIFLHNSVNGEDENAISIEVAGESITWEPEVVVVGQQWWWEYQYHFGDVELTAQRVENLPVPDITTATQMVIPVGEEIELEVTSRDVIHSHWIPALNGKRDAVPGRQSAPWKIEANEPGVFFGQCTEFCGLSHARMRMSSVALSADDFDAWVDNQLEAADIPESRPELAEGEVRPQAEDFEGAALEAFFEQEEEFLAAEGRVIFQANCTSCHVVREDENDADGTAFEYGPNFEAALVSRAAPELTHFATRSVYAGAIYSQYVEVDADDDDLLDVLGDSSYLELSDELRLNEAQLRRWISNAPSQKAMDPDNGLGMPAFPQLTEADLEALVAYMATLD